VSDARTQIVARGYDKLAEQFAAWSTRVENDPRLRFLQELTMELQLDELVTIREPEGEATFQWVLARR
jgi:hypothetical protein